MSAAAIQVQGLGKRYRLGASKAPYRTLRETVVETGSRVLKAVLGRGQPAGGGDSVFWALRDVSFDIAEGEVLGIIGRNGAGKSTLLKILSRITEPTEGKAVLRGRIGSLLEVGTGFHPELTGRENIFLNGAILGMKRREITRHFDEIVAFAEVARFLDTQVKFYSSGMYLRLAFAVAAHLDPEILLVDEVLAVGDAAFQRKCLARMGEVASEGRTILFVSHNMAAVERLCTRGVVLHEGGVAYDGPVRAALSHYLNHAGAAGAGELENPERRQGKGRVRFTRARFRSEGNETMVVAAGADLELGLEYRVTVSEPIHGVRIRVSFASVLGETAFTCQSNISCEDFATLPGPTGTIWLTIPGLPLNQGLYRLSVVLKADGESQDVLTSAIELTVQGGDFYGTGRLLPPDTGLVLVKHAFRVEGAR
jgi:lipopolysaccharide transport system ATP-binding protein